MKQFYLVMGLGFVRTKTLKAFPGVTEGRRRPPREPSRFRLNTGRAAGLECSTCVSTGPGRPPRRAAAAQSVSIERERGLLA